ncbi:hypothetical protein C8J57DRAFT_1223657 [Mycena rebaudengoi]|nr:hypothetical protein C8J57DRAFT_1223657 [Mycena rebaudengoi]
MRFTFFAAILALALSAAARECHCEGEHTILCSDDLRHHRNLRPAVNRCGQRDTMGAFEFHRNKKWNSEGLQGYLDKQSLNTAPSSPDQRHGNGRLINAIANVFGQTMEGACAKIKNLGRTFVALWSHAIRVNR